MRDTAWIRIADGVNAEVDYDRGEYDTDCRVLEGRLTGRVQIHRDAVTDGRWGLPLPGDIAYIEENS